MIKKTLKKKSELSVLGSSAHLAITKTAITANAPACLFIATIFIQRDSGLVYFCSNGTKKTCCSQVPHSKQQKVEN